MIRSIIITVFLGISASAYTQEAFNKIYTSAYSQMTGEVLMELNGKIYMAGMGMDTSSYERNLHMTTFDMDGNLLKTILWDSPEVDYETISLWNQNMILREDRFIIPFYSDAYDCTVEIDTSLSYARKIQCDYDTLPGRSATNYGIIWPEDNLLVFGSNAARNMLMSSIDLSNPTAYILII